MDEQREVELYESSDIGEIVGSVPMALQKMGVFALVLFWAILLTGSFFFRYPETLRGDMVIPIADNKQGPVQGYLFLPPTNIGEVRVGAKVLMRTDAYPESDYGLLVGEVRRIHGKPMGKAPTYQVDVSFPGGLETTRGKRLSQELQLVGAGEVVLRESRLIEMLIEPLRVLTNVAGK